MPLSAKLEKLFDEVVSTVVEGVEKGLDSFQGLIDIADLDDFDVVNDAALVILGQVAATGTQSVAFFGDLFHSWAEALGGSIVAFNDMAARLFEQFSNLPDFFRAALSALIRTIDNFPVFFTKLATRMLAHSGAMRRSVETVLLPVFALGTAVFGTDIAANAIWAVLGDDGPQLTKMASAPDLGFNVTSLQGWAQNALNSGAFTLSRGSWLIALILDGLRQAGDFAQLAGGLPTSNAIFDTALAPIVQSVAAMVSDYIEDVETLVELLIGELISQAETDPQLEWQLLKVARFTPVGLFILAITTAIKLVTNPAPWLNLLFTSIEEDDSFKVKRLPAPDKTTKYIVFSDLHRDEKDAERPKYQFGSHDHFLQNANQYLELLRHHADDAKGYTIIEGGDCEELWFHRDVSTLGPDTPPRKLAEIIETHSEIYDLLAQLHAKGRYFRIYGNHDSYVRDAATFEVLRAKMEAYGGPKFVIYDFIIIDGVKTMHDARLDIGLNSEPYKETLPMVVTHGHQWDFWNCDSNSILGKLVVTSVVTPLDLIDDPARDYAGISMSGTPLVNFKQILGSLPVFNSWQSYEPAVVRLDRAQHMSDTDRRMSDDIMYSETLASLMGQFIRVAPTTGAPVPPVIEMTSPLDVSVNIPWSTLCLGHTHNPHNMPYYDLGDLPLAKPILDRLERTIAAVTNGLVDVEIGLVRSYYMNTGVCGWYEGCIWGLDLGDQSHGTGQPKLVNWTTNTRIDRPNNMDWELPHIPDAVLPGVTKKEVQDQLLGLLQTGADRALTYAGVVSVGEVFTHAQHSWKPQSLKIAFDGTAKAADGLMIQTAIGMLPNVEGSFDATLVLPSRVTKELGRLMKKRLPCGHRSHQRCLSSAIAVLAVYSGLAQTGLRGQSDDPASAQAIATLMFLAQLSEAKRGDMAVSMSLADGAVQASFAFKQSRDATPALRAPQRTRRGQGRGFEIEVCVEGTNTPLAGWTVQLEQKSGGKTEVLSSARLDAKGRARLLGVQVAGGALRIPSRAMVKPRLALYAPKSGGRTTKPVTVIPITSAPDRGRLKLAVTYAQMRAGGYYTGASIPTVNARQKALCDGWRKRLSGGRGASSDLCLQDLVLSSLSALDAPKTPFEKHCAKMLKGQLKDEKELKSVAQQAHTARKALKECLGPDYVTCDGSGSLKDLGQRLIKDDARLDKLVKFFGSPTPDPLIVEKLIQSGRGIPFPLKFNFRPPCVEQAANGTLAQDIIDQMEVLRTGEPVILSRPSINQVEVWDPAFHQFVRRGDIHNKELDIWAPHIETASAAPELAQHTVDMDVFLSDPTCLVMMAEPLSSENPNPSGGEQIMVTDVKPGQRVTLRGSGFVDDKVTVRAAFQAWRSELNEGRLVPDDSVLPATGFAGMEAEVWGAQLPVSSNENPITYNGDSITFQWPAAAAAPGLYRIDFEVVNTSEYPSSITQNADCSISIGFEKVTSRTIYMAILPPPSAPPLAVNLADVECFDLTDVAGVFAIPWPDDVRVDTKTLSGRFTIPNGGVEDLVNDILTSFEKSDSKLFYGPGNWQANLKMFPEGLGVGQLEELDYLITAFTLSEIDGVFDQTWARVILTAILIVLIALAVVIAIAIVIALAVYLPAALPLVGKILLASLVFMFEAGYPIAISTIETIVASIDGADELVAGTLPFIGQDIMFARSEVRFHRVQVPGTDLAADPQATAPTSQTFANEAEGGSYAVTLEVSAQA